MDGFIDGVRASKYGSMSLPSGHPAVVFKSKIDGVEYRVILLAGRGFKIGYTSYGDGIYDWWTQILFWYTESDKGSERTSQYERVSQGYFDDYWECRDKNTEDSLHREEEMTEIFNDIVRAIKSGRDPSEIPKDFGLEYMGTM